MITDLDKGSWRRLVRRSGRAFSLLEIMAVVVIMGLLVGAVAVSVRGYISTAKRRRVEQDLIGLENQIHTFWMAKGRYPTTEEGLGILTVETEGYVPSIKVVSDDPWSHPYQYVLQADIGENRGEPFLITCLGSDGEWGGEGTATDITHVEARDRAAKGQ